MLNILGGDKPDSHMQFAKEALKQRRTKIHLYGKGQARKGRKMGHITVTAPTMSEAEHIIQPMVELTGGKQPDEPQEQALVAIVMGSDSDLPVLDPGLAILEKFEIPYTTRITSAHRTPTWMAEFASTAVANGIKVLIAAAGGAAHLPGMAAAHTILPVVGVPVKPTIGDGMDSLLSIVSMPRGVPVAAMAINNSTNAALFAARILALSNASLSKKVEQYVKDAEAEVMEKDRLLHKMGAREYAAKFLQKK